METQDARTMYQPGDLFHIEGERYGRRYELVSWIGEEVTLKPLDGGFNRVVNGSYVSPARNCTLDQIAQELRIAKGELVLAKAEYTKADERVQAADSAERYARARVRELEKELLELAAQG